MTSQTKRLPRHFYRMPPRPCPYLPGRTEQNIFTELTGPDSPSMYDTLTHAGFRRSHNIAYRPVCPGCSACVSVRVLVRAFEPNRSHRRIIKANADLAGRDKPASATLEHYRLFARYVSIRHDDGEMAEMNFADYASMVEESPLTTSILEYRDPAGGLVAACLVDRLRDGLSAVYSFFDPAEQKRGLGNFMVLRLIERCQQLGLPYLYLGYWIAGSRKMAYKARFRPLEALGANGWKRVSDSQLANLD